MMKKFLSATLLGMMLFSYSQVLAFDYSESDEDIEHLSANEDAKINLVKVTPCGNVIQKANYIEVNFAQNFNSKYYKTGDYVQFTFDNDLKTQEGTLLIPCKSSLIARITCIETPRWFSRNAKVFMEFTHILLTDGTKVPVAVQMASKKKYLQEGAKETAGKIATYTLAIGGVGAGMGSAIGAASGNTVTGLIIGGSVGGGVGLVSGIVSPGLHYKAKKGESVILELEDNLKLPR